MPSKDANCDAPDSFLNEVLDQPRALADALDFYFDAQGAQLLAEAADLCRKARRGPAFVGMGSSCYAPLVARHILNAGSRPATVYEAGELFYYGLGDLSDEQVLVAISQSGRTIETQKVVAAVRPAMKVIGVTNEPDSWLADNCDVLLPMLAGAESMSTSKTYVNTIAILSMLAWQTLGRFDDQTKTELGNVAALMAAELDDWETRVRPVFEFLAEPTFLHLIARGPSYATMLQGQVILKEGAHLLTEAQSGASFRHGPFEIIDDHHRAIVSVPTGQTHEIMLKLVQDMAAAGSKVLLLTNTTATDPTGNIYPYALPVVAEYLFPMLDIVAIECLLIAAARQRGVVPGAITKGNKVTVVE